MRPCGVSPLPPSFTLPIWAPRRSASASSGERPCHYGAAIARPRSAWRDIDAPSSHPPSSSPPTPPPRGTHPGVGAPSEVGAVPGAGARVEGVEGQARYVQPERGHNIYGVASLFQRPQHQRVEHGRHSCGCLVSVVMSRVSGDRGAMPRAAGVRPMCLENHSEGSPAAVARAGAMARPIKACTVATDVSAREEGDDVLCGRSTSAAGEDAHEHVPGTDARGETTPSFCKRPPRVHPPTPPAPPFTTC